MQDIDPEFVDHLAQSCGLNVATSRRVILEVLAEYSEASDEFVKRRHLELKGQGNMKNNKIYRQICAEATHRRFKNAQLTERQVRRIIYG